MAVGVMLSAFLGASGGCQGQKEALSKPALIVLDSLRTAREALYDSTLGSLGLERENCLSMRAVAVLGVNTAMKVTEATSVVDARHSTADRESVRRRLVGVYDEPTVESCHRTDSLWYARIVRPPKAGRRP